jgi:hypothetical protein
MIPLPCRLCGRDKDSLSNFEHPHKNSGDAATIKVAHHPIPGSASTSYAERQNLTLRISSRRFTRLTNAFSKKVENHALSVALHYMHYNFCPIHKTLRITPAMAAGVTDRLWGIGDIVNVLEAWEAVGAEA